MLLFRSERHVTAWLESRHLPLGAVLTLEQMWTVARAWYAGRLEPDWRPRAVDGSQAILAGAGLTGEFWDLRSDVAERAE